MSKALLSVVVVGSLAGAAAGVLLAPKRGPVVRRYVRQKGSKYVATFREKAKETTS